MLFSELNLRPSSLKAVNALGFEKPTEIQEKSIPLLLENELDFIGQAQTGTGKTAAFTLPLLEKIDTESSSIQALILAPTRELANQINEEIKKLSKFQQVRTYTIYGGTSVSGQLRELRQIRPQILVATPGRSIDFINRGVLKFENCRYVILDEADEMLDMGFFEDVQSILSKVQEKRIWMFSATMPRQIKDLISKHFCDPHYVKVTKKILTSDAIDQQFCVVKDRSQSEALSRYLDFQQNVYAIIFTRTKIGAKQLMDELNAKGFEADSLHGDMSQDQRDGTMKRFKQKKVKLLVCTDVAARGIDVNDLTHVINYSLPQDNESYVHRIGRTGRGGSKGIALSIITPSEVRRIRDIERITKASIEKINLPNLKEIKDVLYTKCFERFNAAMTSENVPNEEIFAKICAQYADVPLEEILKGIYELAFQETSKRYEGASENLDSRSRDTRDSGSSANSSFTKLSVNMGAEDGLEPGSLLRMLSRLTTIRGSVVGKISIRDDKSFFEVPSDDVDRIMKVNGKVWFNQSINIVNEGPGQSRSRGGGRPRGRSSSRNQKPFARSRRNNSGRSEAYL